MRVLAWTDPRHPTVLNPVIVNDPKFAIIDETEDHIVVDKPAPLKIHPSTPGGAETLWDGLRGLLAFELANGGQISIINRLDRETSGAVLIAKTARKARQLGMAMQRRQISKHYLAVVLGRPEWDEITLQAPILRKGELTPSPIWVRQMVHPQGTPCETFFRVMRRSTSPFGPITLVEAQPKTGRMHQLRVHLAHLGHPIVGDKIYGHDETCYLDFIETGWTPDLAKRLHFHRHMLHSWQLRVETEGFCAHWTAPIPSAWSPLLQDFSPEKTRINDIC